MRTRMQSHVANAALCYARVPAAKKKDMKNWSWATAGISSQASERQAASASYQEVLNLCLLSALETNPFHAQGQLLTDCLALLNPHKSQRLTFHL